MLKVEKGRVKGEDVFALLTDGFAFRYEAFGQTSAGRYLVVFFIRKSEAALPISARDMADSERRYYEKHK